MGRPSIKVLKYAVIALFMLISGCAHPKFVPSYATPKDTFKTWKHAAARLDYNLLVSTYIDSAKDKLLNELSTETEQGLRAMQVEAEDTSFSVEKVIFEDRVAYLRILRKRGRRSEVEVLRMVKENGGWKLLP
jgi:hypothetical protein